MPRVIGLDHIVLAVADVESAMAWYCTTLGLEPMQLEEWRAGTAFFPSARVNATTIIDFVPRADSVDTKNLDHFCLVVERTDFAGLDIIEGPVPRSGAQGMATSVYVRDPDGNTVELRFY